MIVIYYATYLDEMQTEYLVGIFSTSQLAQDACQRWHKSTGNTRKLLWIGRGDALTAASYEINGVELDYVITPDQYAPNPLEA